MQENDISGNIVDCCYKIHLGLGPGMLERVYEKLLAYELSIRQIKFERQKAIPLKYEKPLFEQGLYMESAEGINPSNCAHA